MPETSKRRSDRDRDERTKRSRTEKEEATACLPSTSTAVEVVTVGDEEGDSDEEVDPNPKPRTVYALMIQAGLRLKLKNRSVCTAILLMHDVLKKEVARHVCNYTLATACLMVGLKYEEERNVRIKTVCHVVQSLLSSVLITENSEEVSELANGVGKMEFLVLREVAFRIDYPHPHTQLALILKSLRPWMEEDFDKYPIEDTAASLLRDAYVCPSMILAHTQKSIAIAIVSLALKAFDVTVPQARSDWHEVFSSSLSSRKLRSLEKEILDKVYDIEVD